MALLMQELRCTNSQRKPMGGRLLRRKLSEIPEKYLNQLRRVRVRRARAGLENRCGNQRAARSPRSLRRSERCCSPCSDSDTADIPLTAAPGGGKGWGAPSLFAGARFVPLDRNNLIITFEKLQQVGVLRRDAVRGELLSGCDALDTPGA